MTRTLRRATLAATAVFAVGALAGCGVGFDAQTRLVQGGEGAQARAGDLVIRNAQLVANGTDGSTAALVVALVNDGETADALTNVQVGSPGTSQTESTLPSGSLEVSPGTLVSIGSENGPAVTLRTQPGAVAAGKFVQLSLTFRRAGLVSLTVPVQDRVGPYATVSVAPIPAETATPGATSVPPATPATTPPITPTGSPSPAASPS